MTIHFLHQISVTSSGCGGGSMESNKWAKKAHYKFFFCARPIPSASSTSFLSVSLCTWSVSECRRGLRFCCSSFLPIFCSLFLYLAFFISMNFLLKSIFFRRLLQRHIYSWRFIHINTAIVGFLQRVLFFGLSHSVKMIFCLCFFFVCAWCGLGCLRCLAKVSIQKKRVQNGRERKKCENE